MIFILTKHIGTVEWLGRKGIVGKVVRHLYAKDVEKLGPGDVVYGNAPIEKIAQIIDTGARFVVVSIPIVTKERGVKLRADDLDRKKARLVEVLKVELKEVNK